MGLAATALDARRTSSSERHRAETTTLHAVVRDNVETLYTAVAAGFEGAALPPFVRRELEGCIGASPSPRVVAARAIDLGRNCSGPSAQLRDEHRKQKTLLESRIEDIWAPGHTVAPRS